MVARARRLLPPSSRPRADRIARILYASFGQYFGGSVTVAVMMGLYVLVLGLVFGLPSGGSDAESPEATANLSCGLTGCEATVRGRF